MKKLINTMQEIAIPGDTQYTMEKYQKAFDLRNTLRELGFNAFILGDSTEKEVEVYLKENIRITNNWKDKYSIYSTVKRKYIDYDSQKWILEKNDIKEPNNFKVLTKNIIQKWIDYIETTGKLFDKASEQRQYDVDYFITEFKKIKGSKIETEDFYKKPVLRGSVNNAYFLFDFEVQDNGYINKNLKINYMLKTDIDSLKKLFNN
jgi:hypothetical protein